jgi:hypothetical protein
MTARLSGHNEGVAKEKKVSQAHLDRIAGGIFNEHQ